MQNDINDVVEAPPQGFGLVPSPEDTRDIPLATFASDEALPAAFVLSEFDPLPVENQRKIPSCVAHAASKIKEFHEIKETGKYIDFSPRWTFSMCKKLDGYPGWGTYLRIACKVLAEYGCCPSSVYPEDATLPEDEYKDWSRLTQDSMNAAKPYRVKSYVRVGSDIESIKRGIWDSEGPVMVGLSLSNEGWKQAKVRPPKDGQTKYGHAVIAYGWNAGGEILCRNHWSQFWGDEGNFVIGKDYEPYLFEAWTFMDLPNEIIEGVKTMFRTIKLQGRPEVYVVMGGEKFWIAPYRSYTFGVEKGFLAPLVEVSAEEFVGIPEGGLFTKF